MNNNYSNTEIKIKDAAKSLFLKKGYSATTTRDIARESDINLAMLNYYCLLYTSPSPRDKSSSRMPSSA